MRKDISWCSRVKAMLKYKLILLLSYFVSKCSSIEEVEEMSSKLVTTKTFMFWPNATIPFYINPDHFDQEQAVAIMTSLSMFAFKTCLKFAPVMTAPVGDQHVMVFVNPDGIRRCRIETRGHSTSEPHFVYLGYDCLQSPEVDMIIMKALGFPFEHNRMSRDVYIDVMIENIEPGSIGLFAKDSVLPPALRSLPYDINSVMHFGERAYSKNGHRTILFKGHNMRQNRIGLSATDLKKIELVYGPECRQRDRQEKIELCQSYPGVARRKREIEPPANKSLRVNPDITPPPTPESTDNPDPATEYVTTNLKALGIEEEAQTIIEQVYKLSGLALKNAHEKYCNNASNSSLFNFKFEGQTREKNNGSDLLDILDLIAGYAKTVVDRAVGNLTVFCQDSESAEFYQRQVCNWRFDSRCPKSYRSTKSGRVKYTTQHRPVYKQMTKHDGQGHKYSYDHPQFRSGNVTETLDSTTVSIVPKRKKREVVEITATSPEVALKDKKVQKEKKILKEKAKVIQKEKSESVKKENKTNLKHVLTPGSKESKSGDTRRFFQERRYKVKHPEDRSEVEWEESNVSLDKEKENQKVKEKRIKQEIEVERKQEREKQIDKEIELEAEKVIEKDDNEKDMTDKGSEEKKIMDKTIEENNEKEEDKEIDVEKDEPKKVSASRENDSEKEMDSDKEPEQDKETKVEVEKEVEKSAEESEVETVTEKKKRHRVKVKQAKQEKQEILDLEVEKTKEKEYRLEKKARDRLKNKNRSDPTVPQTIPLNKLNQEFYKERQWPDGVVRYVIKQLREYDLEDLRNRLAEVNSILLKKTCVRLHEVDAKEAQGYDDYLVLDASPDYVTGRVGGKQIFGCVELFRGGQHKQHTAMMVMAMLGFYFEVSRHDRDNHIRVHMRHVRPDKLHHFEKIRDEATLDLPYDYQSATHPAWQFWRKIGKTGISTVATYKEQDPDGSVMRSLGQNPQLLSDLDIVKINSVYGVGCFQNKRASDKVKIRQHRSKLQ